VQAGDEEAAATGLYTYHDARYKNSACFSVAHLYLLRSTRAYRQRHIFAILFRPTRNLPSIAQVTFEGNQVIPQGVLRQAVHLTAVGAPFTESSFRDLLNNAVRPLYEQRGRVRMKVLEVRAQPVSDVETGAKRALRF
jgi:outer membrane protein assembly factor BamA